mmetsp:Transcript_3871/g.13591  ORF Transcript_3871/g.13591 Transcript_3871/m.13591 type:complete len:179 (+) Transcript_3871:1063-1599(+)
MTRKFRRAPPPPPSARVTAKKLHGAGSLTYWEKLRKTTLPSSPSTRAIRARLAAVNLAATAASPDADLDHQRAPEGSPRADGHTASHARGTPSKSSRDQRWGADSARLAAGHTSGECSTRYRTNGTAKRAAVQTLASPARTARPGPECFRLAGWRPAKELRSGRDRKAPWSRMEKPIE